MRGSIRRRGKNSWELTIDLGRDAQGKRLRKFVNVKGKKADAERIMTEFMASLDRGLPPETSKVTVAEFMERWLNDYVVLGRKPNTVKFYAMINRLYLSPSLGHLRLQNLTAANVQSMVRFVLGKGLSPSTARRAYATLHRALECGMKWGLVHRNVCDAIDAPREAKPRIDPPNKATVRLFLDKATEYPNGAAVWLLAYSGMRRGEVCGLKRDDVDFERGTVSILRAVSRVDGELTALEPKSGASRRTIHLDADTLAVLRAHLATQAEQRLALGRGYRDQGYLFGTRTGGILDPDKLTNTWRRIRRDIGVQHRLHDLRHHHATALIEAGVHIKAVQARLGHSSPSFTLAVYSHVTPGMDKEAADAYAKAMSG